mmetsp:Transcript_7618/g.17810  ORF Transcript_7618/g.17810 Transcript_7618/m.17810 type:complete len:234 (-) Transcript_7618:2176-2877(-)
MNATCDNILKRPWPPVHVGRGNKCEQKLIGMGRRAPTSMEVECDSVGPSTRTALGGGRPLLVLRDELGAVDACGGGGGVGLDGRLDELVDRQVILGGHGVRKRGHLVGAPQDGAVEPLERLRGLDVGFDGRLEPLLLAPLARDRLHVGVGLARVDGLVLVHHLRLLLEKTLEHRRAEVLHVLHLEELAVDPHVAVEHLLLVPRERREEDQLHIRGLVDIDELKIVELAERVGA